MSTWKTLSTWLCGFACAAAVAAGGVGSEAVDVGASITGSRQAPALAAASDGRVLVAWEEGDDTPRVLGRVFATDLADPDPVVEIAPATAVEPSVGWGPASGFAVAWNRPEGGSGLNFEPSAILARRFDREDRPTGAVIVVVEGFHTREVLEFFAPQLVSMGGFWAVVYREARLTVRSTYHPALVGRLMRPNGELVGHPVVLDRPCRDIRSFKLAADPAIPEVVVAWSRPLCRGRGGQGTDVLARRYDLQGNVLTSTTVVSDLLQGGVHSVDASVDALGRTAIVWVRAEGRGNPGSQDVAGRRILADGSKLSGGRVPAVREEHQINPAVGVLADGHALVVWERSAAPKEPTRLRGRWFDPDDRPLGEEFDLGNPQALEQRRAVAAVDRGFGVIVAWEERLADGSRQVFLQRFEPGS